MNALQSYSSDEESGNEAPMQKNAKSGDPGTNYDDVGMDISEDSDDEAQSNSKEKASGQPVIDGAHPVGVTQHGMAQSNSSTDNQQNQNETKEGPRSSLQERLLGIASGGRRPSQDDRSGSTARKESQTSPSQNRADQNHRKSKSKSPKAKSPPPRSPSRANKSSNHRGRSRSKSRDRDVGRSGHSGRGHSGREPSNQGRNRDRDRDSRRSREDERKRRDDDRRSRRSRSRSRSRERRRSRSRSRDRRSRSRSRERRRRSRSHERKRPMDIRKEAQQKLAALKAANPDLTAAELMRRSMEAQMEEVKKQTGITLPSYYNPATMNPMKFAEQERKKKLLWGNKSKPAEGNTAGIAQASSGSSSLYGSLMPTSETPTAGIGATLASPGNKGGGQASLWASTRFVNDKDGKMAEKFRRLMGVKDASAADDSVTRDSGIGQPSLTTSTMNGYTRQAKQGFSFCKSSNLARKLSSSPYAESGGSSSSSSNSGAPPNGNKGVDLLQKQETMFTSMERQYEMARLATHTHKGFGLGFTSQSFMPK